MPKLPRGFVEGIGSAIYYVLAGGAVGYCWGATRQWASGDLAAWVQALGTILAIIGTAWVARWQFAANERARRNDELRDARAYSLLIVNVVRDIEKWLTHARNLAAKMAKEWTGSEAPLLAWVSSEGDGLRIDLVGLRHISIHVAGTTAGILDLERAIVLASGALSKVLGAPLDPNAPLVEHPRRCAAEFAEYDVMCVERIEALLSVCFEYSRACESR